jgi:hypothetical protein
MTKTEDSRGCTVVEQSAHDSTFKGSNPGSGREDLK